MLVNGINGYRILFKTTKYREFWVCKQTFNEIDKINNFWCVFCFLFRRWLPLISLVVYMIGFSIGFGCIPFLLLGELFPANQRSVLSSIAGSFNLGVMFIVIKTYHYLEAVSDFFV